MSHRTSSILLALAGFIMLCGWAHATEWHTGNQFRAALRRPVGVTWADTPIREALDTLSKAQRVAIFLDRRVDPAMLISSSSALAPFEDTLRDALRPYKLGVGFVGPVVYVGPKQTAARIATLAELRNEKAAKFPLELRKSFTKRTQLSWEDLSEPSAIVAGLGDRANLEFGNITAIPHDVWRGIELPEMTLAESLTLVLAGFSMNFTLDNEADKQQLMVTRFPIGVSIARTYPLGKNPEQTIQKIEKLLPQAFVERKGKRAVVRSLLEDHWKLQASLESNGIKKATPESQQRAYTLKVENKPVGKVIEILADQIGLSVDFAAGCKPQLPQLVSFSVKEATAEELLGAAAKEAGLKVQITGTTVLVSPN